MFAILARNAKVIALIAGFVFATLGTLWSLFVIDNLNAQLAQLADAQAETVANIETLNRKASDYFIANQQGDLIYIMAQRQDANQGVANDIYRGNLLDRATPVRDMIGALAQLQQLDYRQTYDAYEKLNDTARADGTYENFMRLKQREYEIIAQGQALVPKLVQQSIDLGRASAARQAEQTRNRQLGGIAAVAGSALLLGANLLAEKKNSTERKNAD